MRKLLLATVALGALTSGAQAAFLVTYEKPGVLNSTATFTYKGVEHFTNRSSGSFATDFGTTGHSTVISGTYTDVEISGANVYGGATNDAFPVTFSGTGYSLELSATSNGNPMSVTYFGYWLSALDRGNALDLSRDGTVVFTFRPADVVNVVGACNAGNNPYCGNPVAGPYQGGNGAEPYVFVNFYDLSGQGFDKVTFYESPLSGGYESDNHTVGFYEQIGGIAVPEPASPLALLGIGLLGLSLVRRARQPAVA